MVIDPDRAVDLLNNGYVPPGGMDTPREKLYELEGEFIDLLMVEGKNIGIKDFDEIGCAGFFDQGEQALRAELTQWRMLENGLLTKLVKFLSERAPTSCIIMTFSFEDIDERWCESPIIIVFKDEIVGHFSDCDLADNPYSIRV